MWLACVAAALETECPMPELSLAQALLHLLLAITITCGQELPSAAPQSSIGRPLEPADDAPAATPPRPPPGKTCYIENDWACLEQCFIDAA